MIMPMGRSRSRSASPHNSSRSSYRIRILNISYDATAQDLRNLFREKLGFCGLLEMNMRNGKHDGTATIDFKFKDGADKAVKVMDQMPLNGRELRVKEDRQEAVPLTNLTERDLMAAELAQQLKIEGPVTDSVFVSNIDFHVTWNDLRNLLRTAGDIVSGNIKQDAAGKSRGMSIVRFSHACEALNAISMFNGYMINDRPLSIRIDRDATPYDVPSVPQHMFKARTEYLPPAMPNRLNEERLVERMPYTKDVHVRESENRNFSADIRNRESSLPQSEFRREVDFGGLLPTRVFPEAAESREALRGVESNELISAILQEIMGKGAGNLGANPAKTLTDLAGIAKMMSPGASQLPPSATDNGALRSLLPSNNIAGDFMKASQSGDFSRLFLGDGTTGASIRPMPNKAELPYTTPRMPTHLLEPKMELPINREPFYEQRGNGICRTNERKYLPRKLIISNIPFTYTAAELRDIFVDCRGVRTTDILSDPNGRSRGIGVITFEDYEDAMNAKARFDRIRLDGRTIVIDLE